MAYVNKVKKGSEEWDIQDARIPEAEQADEGKVVKVNAQGEYELGEGGGSEPEPSVEITCLKSMTVADFVTTYADQFPSLETKYCKLSLINYVGDQYPLVWLVHITRRPGPNVIEFAGSSIDEGKLIVSYVTESFGSTETMYDVKMKADFTPSKGNFITSVPTIDDADKVLHAGSNGSTYWGNVSGGTKLYKHALAKSDFTVGADIITNSSGSLFDTEQTIISVNNVKGVAQYGGNYYIALQNYFNRAGDTIVGFSITSLLVSNLETVETLSFDGSNATETITAL